jgi:hypothetical protein
MDPSSEARDQTETDLNRADRRHGLRPVGRRHLSGTMTFLDAETLRETGDPVELRERRSGHHVRRGPVGAG